MAFANGSSLVLLARGSRCGSFSSLAGMSCGFVYTSLSIVLLETQIAVCSNQPLTAAFTERDPLSQGVCLDEPNELPEGSAAAHRNLAGSLY